MAETTRVLVAEDGEDEVFIYKHAFAKIGLSDYIFLPNGEEVIRYLKGEGEYCDRVAHPFPRWLLLDLKMPRVDGFGVLQWLQTHPHCRVVPTVMMSNSNIPNDVATAYHLGVNVFFTKPSELGRMVDLLALIQHFWTIAERPPVTPQSSCE